jgi:hypothetical protein
MFVRAKCRRAFQMNARTRLLSEEFKEMEVHGGQPGDSAQLREFRFEVSDADRARSEPSLTFFLERACHRVQPRRVPNRVIWIPRTERGEDCRREVRPLGASRDVSESRSARVVSMDGALLYESKLVDELLAPNFLDYVGRAVHWSQRFVGNSSAVPA